MPTVENVVMVGSGPAGYPAALCLARAGRSPIVLSSPVEAGGALDSATRVEILLGFPDGIMGPELMEDMRKQSERFGARRVYDDATALELTGALANPKITPGGSSEIREATGDESLTGLTLCDTVIGTESTTDATGLARYAGHEGALVG